MSAKKKPKKLRRPNIVVPGMSSGPAESRGGGAEVYPPSTPTRADSRFNFDYTHVKTDMRRIGLLAGICVTALVVLSFIIRGAAPRMCRRRVTRHGSREVRGLPVVPAEESP